MREPSLLWMGDLPAAAVGRQTLVDCGLTAALPSAALDVLARHCSREEIAMRQAVFVRMRGDDAGRYAALGAALDRLAGAYHAYHHAATQLEALCLGAALLRCYADLFPLVSAMADDGALTPLHREFWPMQAAMYAELTAALPMIEAELQRLGDVVMLRDERSGWRLDVGGDEAKAATAVRAAACAAALGLTLSEARPSPMRLDASIADAWLAVQDEAAAALTSALACFEGLPIESLLRCREELHVFTAVCDLLARAEARGLAVTLPTMADVPTYDADALCDLALLSGEREIVPNDARMTAGRRFFFLTGANGGGKTTYLRTLVGNLLLARGGCPIVAARAVIYPWRHIATHFPADEHFEGSGRFVDEQNRAETLTALAATQGDECFFCFNETFSGTDHAKGLAHATALARAMQDSGVSGLFVTHFHEVAALGLPMLCTVVAGEDNRRTYRIVEQAGIGSSFARDVLRKYRLDAASLAARAAHEGVTVCS